MHFNFHLSGDESPEQSRRIANAVLALGGLLTPSKSIGELTLDLKIDTSEATAALDKLSAHPGFAQDPIVEMASGWYHYDETWSQVCGPYGSREQAQAALGTYASALNSPPYTEAEQFAGALTGDEIRAVESFPPAPPVAKSPLHSAAVRAKDHVLQETFGELSTAPLVPAASAVAPSGLDAKGLPWDDRIHSSSRAINADGTWRYRKNVPDETKRAVEHQLRSFTTGNYSTDPELDSTLQQDAEMLRAMGADPGPTLQDFGLDSGVAPPVPLPPTPPAPPVPTGALQRTYSDVVNLIMSRKVQPDTYVAILGMSLPEFAKHVISAPNDATLMFDALDAASRP